MIVVILEVFAMLWEWLLVNKGISLDDFCNLDVVAQHNLLIDYEEWGKEQYWNEIKAGAGHPLFS